MARTAAECNASNRVLIARGEKKFGGGGRDVLHEGLGEGQGNAGVSLNVNMAYYLNQIRSRATLLGVGVAVTPNYYQARNILQ